MPPRQSIADQIFDRLGISNSVVQDLTKAPKKDPTPTTWLRDNIKKNQYHQIDTLYLPNDNGYKYLVVAVDIATRATDAIPVKRLTSAVILKAIKQIYTNGKYLSIPQMFHIDSGTEWAKAKKYWKDKKIGFRVAATNRHSQQAVVESMNKVLGSVISKIQLHNELIAGDEETGWVDELPQVLEVVNENRRRRRFKNTKGNEGVLCKGRECHTYAIGDKVHRVLDYPMNYSGRRLGSTFRSGDLRFSTETYKITNILMYPKQPIRYVLQGIVTHTFSKNQLKPAQDRQPQSNSRGQYVVEKILARKKIRGKVHYRVKWLGYPSSANTWEPRTTLIRQIPDIINEFEDSSDEDSSDEED